MTEASDRFLIVYGKLTNTITTSISQFCFRASLIHIPFLQTNVTESWIEYGIGSKPHRVPCFWIESILRANAISTIDVLTINVNGKEELVLRSFPFDKIHVTILTVVLNGKFAIPDSISSLMSERGFRTVKLMSNHILDKTDLIFLNQLKTSKM